MFEEQLPFSLAQLVKSKWKPVVPADDSRGRALCQASGAQGACERNRAMADRQPTQISVAEMQSYYLYSEWCSWLHSVAEGESSLPVPERPTGCSSSAGWVVCGEGAQAALGLVESVLHGLAWPGLPRTLQWLRVGIQMYVSPPGWHHLPKADNIPCLGWRFRSVA